MKGRVRLFLFTLRYVSFKVGRGDVENAT